MTDSAAPDLRILVAAQLLAADLSLAVLANAPAARRRRAFAFALIAADELVSLAGADLRAEVEGMFAGDVTIARRLAVVEPPPEGA